MTKRKKDKYILFVTRIINIFTYIIMHKCVLPCVHPT